MRLHASPERHHACGDALLQAFDNMNMPQLQDNMDTSSSTLELAWDTAGSPPASQATSTAELTVELAAAGSHEPSSQEHATLIWAGEDVLSLGRSQAAHTGIQHTGQPLLYAHLRPQLPSNLSLPDLQLSDHNSDHTAAQERPLSTTPHTPTHTVWHQNSGDYQPDRHVGSTLDSAAHRSPRIEKQPRGVRGRQDMRKVVSSASEFGSAPSLTEFEAAASPWLPPRGVFWLAGIATFLIHWCVSLAGAILYASHAFSAVHRLVAGPTCAAGADAAAGSMGDASDPMAVSANQACLQPNVSKASAHSAASVLGGDGAQAAQCAVCAASWVLCLVLLSICLGLHATG